MLFPSVVFLAVFAPLFLVCYFALPWRNLTFFLFSLGFFYWGEHKYIGVLLAFVAINYLFGLLVGRAERPERRRLFLGLGVGAVAGGFQFTRRGQHRVAGAGPAGRAFCPGGAGAALHPSLPAAPACPQRIRAGRAGGCARLATHS